MNGENRSAVSDAPEGTQEAQTTVPESRPGLPLGARVGAATTRYGLIILTLLMFAVFSVILPSTFPTSSNILGILGTQATVGILALAVLLPLMAGQFDLSVGNMLGLGMTLAVWLAGNHHVATFATIAIVLAVGLIVGLVNAFFIEIVGLSAFIATLGMGTILGGCQLLVSGGQVLFGIPASMKAIGQDQIWRLPLPFVYFVVLTGIMWYVSEQTPFGRMVAAVGFGRPSARLAGLRTRGLVAASFCASGLLAALAGIVNAAQLGSAAPTSGPEFLLPAFAAAFLGATTIKQGQFNALGTFVAVYFLEIGLVGLQQLGLPFWFAPIFNGTALLVAVSATAIVARRSRLAGTD